MYISNEYFLHGCLILLLMCISCGFQAKEKEIRGTRFVITGLKTGGHYRFRVTAFNAAGNSEPGEVPEALEVKDRASELDLYLLITLVVVLLLKCIKAASFSE